MSDAEEVREWASLIPEIYYDLIARIPAGTLLVLGILSYQRLLTSGAPFDLQKLRYSSGAFILVLLVLLLGTGYVASMLLTPLCSFLYGRYRPLLWKRYREEYEKEIVEFMQVVQLKFQSVQPSKLDLRQIEEFEQQMHDFLMAKSDHARVILPKMRAEASLCNNLTLVLSLFLLLALHYPIVGLISGQGFLTEQIFQVVVVILLGLLSSFAGWHRTDRLNRRQFSFWRLVRQSSPAG